MLMFPLPPLDKMAFRRDRMEGDLELARARVRALSPPRSLEGPSGAMFRSALVIRERAKGRSG